MTDSEINSTYQKICTYLRERQLFDAFEQIHLLLNELQEWWATEQTENLSNIYRRMLQYYVEGADDPHREQFFCKLQADIFLLADRIREELLTKTSTSLEYIRKRQQIGEIVDFEKVTAILNCFSVENWLENSPISEEENFAHPAQLEIAITQLFSHFWLTTDWTAKEKNFLEEIFNSEEFNLPAKLSIVSAIMLNLLRMFDPPKLVFLLSQVQNSVEKVRLRAITAVVLVCCRHRERLHFHTSILLQLEILEGDKQFQNELEIVVIQLIHSLITEQVTQHILDDVLPTMQKSAPIIADYLRKNKTPEENFENDFPDLDELLENLPFKDKIQEMEEMVLNGDDVYFGTFKNLKYSPFFSEISNWFLPFDRRHSAVSTYLDAKNEVFNAFFDTIDLCDSDKYSFCINLLQSDASTKNGWANELEKMYEPMKEMMDESKSLTGKTPIERLAKHYVHDLYRFFELNAVYKKQDNPLRNILDFPQTLIFTKIVKNSDSQQRIADFLLLKHFYSQAFVIYSNILKNREFVSAKLFNNAGFCLQKTKQFAKALDFYQNAELLEPNNRWTLQHCAYCCRNLQNYEQAEDYYQKLLELLPDNLAALNGLAICFFNQNEFQKALDIYFKINYLKPDDPKYLRLISWCNFMLGNYESSEKFCRKTIEIGGENSDFLNLGHLFLVQKRTKEAVENYQIALQKSENGAEFWQLFEADENYLIQKGVEKSVISLVCDAIKFNK